MHVLLAGAASAIVAVPVLIRARLVLVSVSGGSMEPTFVQGDRLLVVRTRRVRRGDVVLLAGLPAAVAAGTPIDHDPRVPEIATPGPVDRSAGLSVKRVAAVPGDVVPQAVAEGMGWAITTMVPSGHLAVLGDSPRSIDSRQVGLIALSDVVGRTLVRLPVRRGPTR